MTPDPRADRDPLAEPRRPERVDLDTVQARSDSAMHYEEETNGYVLAQRWHQSVADVPALLGELRAAREVVAATRETQEHPGWFIRVSTALDAYDQATGAAL